MLTFLRPITSMVQTERRAHGGRPVNREAIRLRVRSLWKRLQRHSIFDIRLMSDKDRLASREHPKRPKVLPREKEDKGRPNIVLLPSILRGIPTSGTGEGGRGNRSELPVFINKRAQNSRLPARSIITPREFPECSELAQGHTYLRRRTASHW